MPVCTVPADAQGVAAQIVALAGQGQAREGDAAPWSVATLAQRLQPGSSLRTLELSSAALLLADRTQIRMAAQSLLRLCDARAQQVRLDLSAGRLWSRSKGPAVDVQLHTPAAVAAVRGTDWDVEVDAQGRTTLTVLTGQVAVSNAQGSVAVGPSEQAVVEPGQAPTKRYLVQARERVQWVMANALIPSRWPELAAPLPAWHAPVLQALRSGQLALVRTEVQARLQVQPDDVLAQRLLAETEVAAGRLQAAQQLLQGLWQRTHDARAGARYAELLQAQDQDEAAQHFLEQALVQAPQAVALRLARAEQLRRAGQAAAALHLYQQASAQAQDSAEQAGVQALWGSALLDQGDVHAARARLAQAVQAQPEDADYQARAALADVQALQHAQAQHGFAAALAQTGDDYVALAGSGLLALQRGDFEVARESLLKALVIEPRYAAAQVWLAVAEYRLDNLGAAFDALERARSADPNDPLPWQVEAMLRNDAGEPELALTAARAALQRLPYLKSLNPLASDSQGSANLGRTLGDFGLEHWARVYAQQSYYPLWAGSHFFMAQRYESDYAGNSELFQGYLSDPLAFGASERYLSVLPSEGQEWRTIGGINRGTPHHRAGAIVTHVGLSSSPVPVAWNATLQLYHLRPQSGSGSYRMTAPVGLWGLGVRPTDRLALLLMHQNQRIRYAFPGGVQMAPELWFNSQARLRSQRTDLGGSWRWSVDEHTWLKWHSVTTAQHMGLEDQVAGPQDSRAYQNERGFMLRHLLQQGSRRWSLGWEHVTSTQEGSLGNALVMTQEQTRLRMDVPWMAYEDSQGPWHWYAHASWPRLQADWHARYHSPALGTDLIDPLLDHGRDARGLLPRLGLSYRWGPARALHAAYLESVRGIGAHTLAPVALGAVPVDYLYQRPGSFARKWAVQWDWEIDARNFAAAALTRQEILNPTYAGGTLLVPSQAMVDFDSASVLGPQYQVAKAWIESYDGDPQFGRGRLTQATLGWNRVLNAHWTGLLGYTYTHSRNTGGHYEGNTLPGFARHALTLSTLLRHSGRGFTQASLVFRSRRFADEAHTTVQAAGWSLSLAHSWETSDRRWSVQGVLKAPLDGRTAPDVWLRARYRF